ncbi:hypothetical protein BHM03_00032852 [Ensete ventricosum]|nr:hypothetical protein BHM03_00032852 [Ensete ventricosum]
MNLFLHLSQLPVTPPGCPAANPIAVADGGTTGNAVAASPPAAEADRHHQLAAAAAADSSFRWPPTGAEDAQITQVLYGRSQRRRLPRTVACERIAVCRTY